MNGYGAPPGRFCRNRLFEWVTTSTMVLIAFTIVLIAGDAATKGGSFRFLNAAGFTDYSMAAFFGLFGALRIAALFANGRWHPYGPWVRSAGAMAGALVWGQLWVSLIYTYLELGIVYPAALPLYLCLTIGELIACYRAAVDARRESA